MGQDSLRVIARVKARVDKGDELQAVLLGLIAPTRQEPGCITYEMLQNKEDATEFTFVEEWTDEAALESHFGTSHIQDALKKFPNLLAEELDLRRYVLVA
ncbi:MAG: putative quinol monooxygenase [Candidatus Methylomirabilales bacterium]